MDEIFFLLSLSIFFPLIIGIYVSTRIDHAKYPIFPIVLCSLLGCITELLSKIWGNIEVVNFVLNFYLLLEYVLLLYQLYLWNEDRVKWKFITLIVVGILVWVSVNVIYTDWGERNPLIRLFNSFVVVLACMQLLNKMIFSTQSLKRNFVLLICISFIFFYTFGIFVDIFTMYYKLFSHQFIVNVFFIKSIFNVLSNVVISIALLCIPKKQQYSLSL